MSDVWLVVGLGNPGAEYERTRHNVGQVVLDELASRTRGSFKRHRSGARVAEVRLGVLPGGAPGPRVVLAAPTSWMNLSGGQVAGLVKYFDADVEHLVVVHDELDVDFGSVRLKRGGGEGGHNGLRSISKSLGDKDYARVRVGIGRPPGRQDPADFVLKEFSSTEKKDLPFLVMDAADAVEKLVVEGLEAAQQKFHAPA
ncbi:aminoacyl-tRNA hydrolase [Kineococcus aurantiacus]|uniref:Peptidyl-tRNA hydrolase n=1 Tax=Kineococcus aurantiacus TaxID=37633 RepID=A0A7Y9DNV0_9ACTN|nr:PTH1 family peptidyl-tRNA hydrolase [Kineococcus aurantiacus]